MVRIDVAFIFFLNCTNEKAISKNHQSHSYLPAVATLHQALANDDFRDFGFDFHRRIIRTSQSFGFEIYGGRSDQTDATSQSDGTRNPRSDFDFNHTFRKRTGKYFYSVWSEILWRKN